MDHDQFRRIYAVSFHQVFRYALAMTGQHSIAEEITQEAFLKLLRNGSGSEKIENPEAWLVRVARNLAIQAFRQRQKQIDRLPTTSDESPEDLLIGNERWRQILQAIAALSESQRDCLALREFAGLSYQSIAKELEISVDQVKVQLFRARQNLRQQLEGVK